MRLMNDVMHEQRWLAIGLFALGLLLAVNAVIGPLVLDLIDYPFSDSIRNQGIGLEVVSLGLVAPWSLLAGWANWQRKTWAPILAVAPGAYAAYMMAQYVIGPNYLVYARPIPLHLAIFVMAGLVAMGGWAVTKPGGLPLPPHRRLLGYVAIGLGVFVIFRYLPALAGSLGEEDLTDEFAQDPAMFWTIFLLDLGVIVPAAVATAIATFRRAAVASKAIYVLLGWFTLVPISVASMSIVMLINDDPNKSVGSMVMFSIAAVLFTAFAVWVHLPLLRQEEG